MIGPSSSAADLIAHLRTLRSEDNIAGMARFGIATEGAIGISNPDLQKIARLAGKDHARARALWASGIREARIGRGQAGGDRGRVGGAACQLGPLQPARLA